ncbi:phosphomannomutase [Shimia sp. WX04]|uniref:phosphomannomutase n=1 Tax=Shimia ponticola TaxID=2582893 RepID=UPI002106AA35
MSSRLACFKSYDVRGKVGPDMDADLFRRIGQAFAVHFKPTLVVTGRDARDSSPELQQAVNEGLISMGVDVIDLGLCGTEEVYFGTAHYGAGGGMMVTASHNPMGDNGLKMVREESRPISWDGGLNAIHDLAVAGAFTTADTPGSIKAENPRAAYVERVLSFIDVAGLKPMKILVNAGNGAAGPTFDSIADALAAANAPLTFERIHHTPDETFPNGIPNPLLPENQPATADPVIASGADFGVAWDGDFDRCFFFDAEGDFIPGEYIVGLLSKALLASNPGQTIVHDPRVVWNTRKVVAEAGGTAQPSRTGHALIKETMRDVDAVYGGEMSAHHYFKEFMYCDSGMIPWVLVADLVSKTGQSLRELVAQMKADFPSSGEINFRIADTDAAFAAVEAAFEPDCIEADRLDGLSFAYDNWRMNLRRSNTEPVVRLNVETRGDADLLADRVGAVKAVLGVD